MDDVESRYYGDSWQSPTRDYSTTGSDRTRDPDTEYSRCSTAGLTRDRDYTSRSRSRSRSPSSPLPLDIPRGRPGPRASTSIIADDVGYSDRDRDRYRNPVGDHYGSSGGRSCSAGEYDARTRSPVSPGRRSHSPTSPGRGPSPKRVTWKDPVEQKKSLNHVRFRTRWLTQFVLYFCLSVCLYCCMSSLPFIPHYADGNKTGALVFLLILSYDLNILNLSGLFLFHILISIH